jgi:hypothetical protein
VRSSLTPPPTAHQVRTADEDLPVLSGTIPVRKSARAPSLFCTTAGRQVVTASGRAVVWEFEDEAFVLETRRIRIDDVFFTPAL